MYHPWSFIIELFIVVGIVILLINAV